MRSGDAHDPDDEPLTRSDIKRDRSSAFRRSIGLTALGTVIPGAGLTQTRRKVFGWLMLCLAVIVVAGIGYFVMSKGVKDFALQVASRPGWLLWIAIGVGALALLWVGSIIATAILTRPRPLDAVRSRVLVAFTALMVLAIGGTSYKAAEYMLITKDTVEQVFKADPGTKPGSEAKVVEGEDPWKDTPRVNILLLGSDAGVNREGTRTDSMIVASIDTKTGRTTLISLPRNMQRVPLPKDSPLRKLYPSGTYGVPNCIRLQREYQQTGQKTDYCLLNAIWSEADEQAANDPAAYAGIESAGRYETKQVIGEVVGMKIDHMVVIDFKGFQQLIDAMGGVQINVKLTGNGGKLPLGGKVNAYGHVVGVKSYFEPGSQHLDGYHALWYARSRAGDDDFYRQARQRCVIQAVSSQVNPASMVAAYPDIARIARNNIYTDIPAQNLPAFVTLMERVQKNKMVSLGLDQTNGVDVIDPDWKAVHQLIQTKIAPPVPKPSSTSTAPGTTSTTTKPTTKPTTTTSRPEYPTPIDEYSICD